MEEFHHFFTCFFPVSPERGQAFGHIHGTIPRHFFVFSLKIFFPQSVASLCATFFKSGSGVERAPERRRSLPPGLRLRCWLRRRQAASPPAWVLRRGGYHPPAQIMCKHFACGRDGGRECFAPGRVTFCADRKSPKNCLREGGFRFPPSPRYPIPLKRPIRGAAGPYPLCLASLDISP